MRFYVSTVEELESTGGAERSIGAVERGFYPMFPGRAPWIFPMKPFGNVEMHLCERTMMFAVEKQH